MDIYKDYPDKENFFKKSFNRLAGTDKLQQQIKDGITIRAVRIKNTPQSPFSQSTSAPDEDAKVVLPAVPIDANKAYWVAVYARSTNKEINATKATVANAAAISSKITAIANKSSDLSLQAKILNKKFQNHLIHTINKIDFHQGSWVKFKKNISDICFINIKKNNKYV